MGIRWTSIAAYAFLIASLLGSSQGHAQDKPASGDKPAVPAPLVAKPGHAIGRATFSDGKPIPAFTVVCSGFVGDANRATVTAPATIAHGDAKDGTYDLEVPAGFAANLSAKTAIEYNGKPYKLELWPTDGKLSLRDGKGIGPDTRPGIVRDFVAKISGLRPGGDDKSPVLRKLAYYGARIDLGDGGIGNRRLNQDFPKDATVVVRLTPRGPLLDGSKGEPIVKRLPLADMGSNAACVLDIPIGLYDAKVAVAAADGTETPVRVRLSGGPQEWQAAVALDFPPQGPETALSGAKPAALNLQK
ncbi:hypothetical protein [Humisphaera borealis]|uniref:Carboxypeptidase regulatory-like domain-containing protein n=1 Tax=Humisphaera borealis TaxID=2807512 RepID=A0A7M2WXD3_9BACT|nr:hypothetical protein [Humisphaera borealis]QOV90014.1 hypothetical protein IPV69_01170 [Humisphaera borealis]